MAVTWGAVGTGASGTTSCTPSYPTGISAATSKLFCFVTGRSNTANTAPTMPAGWTAVLDFEGGTGTWGVDTGTRRVTIFKKDTVDGTESGTVTVSLAGTTNNTLRATIHRLEVTSGYGVSVAASTGADTTNDTSYSSTGSSNLPFAAGTLLLVAVAQNIDTGTQTSQAISASGITFGTRTNRASTAVTNGNDHRHIVDSVPVTSGSGSVAPTYSYTISAAGSGPTGFLLITEVAPPSITAQPSDDSVTEGDTGNFSVTATGSISGYQWQVNTGGAGGSGPAALTGSVVALTFDKSATPSQQGITVPADAQAVFVMGSLYGPSLTGISNDFADTFTIVDQASTGGTNGVFVAWARVTSTGSKNIAPVWNSSVAFGPAFMVGFVKGIPASGDYVRATGSGGSDPRTTAAAGDPLALTLPSASDDFVVGYDGQDSAAPGNETGWTSLQTQANELAGRVRSCDAPGAGTTTINCQGTAYPVLSMLAFISDAGGGSWADVTDGTGGTTSSYTTPATTLSMDGYQYRVNVTGDGGTVTSDPATLTVTSGTPAVSLTTSVALAVQAARSAASSVALAVRGTSQTSASISAALAETKNAQSDLALAIRQARASSSALSAAVLAVHDQQASISAAISTTNGEQSDVSIAVAQSASQAADVSTAVQFDRSESASLSAAIRRARQASSDLAAAVQRAESLTADVNLMIQAPAQALASVDVLVREARSASASLDLAVRSARSASVDLAAAVQQSMTASADLSAAVQTGRQTGTDLQAAVQAARTASLGVALQVQDGFLILIGLQTAVQMVRNAGAAVSAAVRRLASESISLAAAVRVEQYIGAQVSAAVLLQRSASLGVSAFVVIDGQLMRWAGSTWEPASLKRWNGATWADSEIKRFDGADWV